MGVSEGNTADDKARAARDAAIREQRKTNTSLTKASEARAAGNRVEAVNHTVKAGDSRLRGT
jgi:hypothetical protein